MLKHVIAGMLWVHDGTTWISANTLGNALQQAGGIGVQWPINGHGVIERVEISVPRGIHVDGTLPSGHASKGIREVPLLINGRRMGFVRWSTTPDGTYYFSTKSTLPLIHRINLSSQWTGSSQGVVHWELNQANVKNKVRSKFGKHLGWRRVLRK